MNNKCLLCGSTNIKSVSYPSSKSNTLGFKFISKCLECGFGKTQTDLTDADLGAFYSSGNYWNEVSLSRNLEIHYRNQSDFRLKRLKKVLEKKDLEILDYGAGFGFLLDALKKETTLRFRYHFYEPDNSTRDYFKKRSKNDASVVIHDKLSGSQKYDVIFVNHVLEHVLDPDSFIEKLKSFLTPHGILYIEVPHSDERFKSDVFPHTLFFTKKSLELLLQQHGLEMVKSEVFGHLAAEKRTGLSQKVFYKLLTKAYSLTIRVSQIGVSSFINRLMFGYESYSENGIWLFSVSTPTKDFK